MNEEYVVGLNIYQYRAIFDEALEGEMINVSLEREELDDARRSRAPVPEAFAIDDAPATPSMATGIAVAWSGGDDVTRASSR